MKILLAEDDVKSAQYLKQGLEENGIVVDWVSDGREALNCCLYNQYDLAIFDRMMPGMDGLTLLKALRSSKCDVPVIFLTAMSDIDDRVEGLMAGSDDYIVKPFHLSELLARITVINRRPKEVDKKTVLIIHDLTLDLMKRVAIRQGKEIELLAKEFSVLELLMENAENVVTKSLILEKVWDFSFNPGTTVIETHMSKLRQKLDKPFDIALIHTIRNMGYSIRAPK